MSVLDKSKSGLEILTKTECEYKKPMSKVTTTAKKSVKAVLSVLLLALVCYGGYRITAQDAPLYMTVHPVKRNILKQVFATGTLAGQTQVDVGSQVSGQILKLYVQTGDEVRQGDLLCEVDPRIQETALRSAKSEVAIIDAKIEAKGAELKKLKLEFERQNRLRKLDATSKQDAEVAEAAYDVANAALTQLRAERQKAQLSVDNAQTNLEYTKIRAPIDGTVFAVVVSEGQTVNASQKTPTILRIATLDHMKVRTEISEADVVSVAPGMECQFTILGLPYRSFKGKLDRIDPAPGGYKDSSVSSAMKTASATSNVYYNSDIITNNFDRTLRIDMTADVTINIADKKDVLALPLSALRSLYRETAIIYTVDNLGFVQRKVIKVGLKDDQYIEVIDGLGKDENVIIGDDVKSAEAAAMKRSSIISSRGPF